VKLPALKGRGLQGSDPVSATIIEKEVEEMIEKIQFYTAGCPRSQISEKNLRKVLTKMGLEVEVESIDDPKIHEAHGVSAFPGLKINGEIKSEGKFITVDQCEDILSEYIDS
jgi:hypothetical protein